MAQLGIQQKTDIDAENKINNELEESFETWEGVNNRWVQIQYGVK